ncbi:MAG: phytanoyl-CoA dioxygenase family protein [Cocleimonas sp.]
MINLVKIPLWIFELFTTSKSFRDNPIIGSPVLNKMGLHVIRLLVSHAIMRTRMWFLALSISVEDRKSFFDNGYIAIENFLSDEAFVTLEKEARAFKGEIREARQGDTLTHRGVLSPDVLQQHPAIKKVLNSKKLSRLAKFSSGHFRAPLYYLEQVKNKYCEGAADPQKTLHNDTFHPSMKVWFFIDDVAPEAGAFTFVLGSHKLSWERLKWHYRMSIDAKNNSNTLHARGSTRYSLDDLKTLGLPEPHAFTVKKNTLLIVNVFGIHRRGDSLTKSTRMAIWGDSRTNPFIPFPGIGGKFANRLQYYFLELYRKNVDESAQKRGVPSPWKVILPEDK